MVSSFNPPPDNQDEEERGSSSGLDDSGYIEDNDPLESSQRYAFGDDQAHPSASPAFNQQARRVSTPPTPNTSRRRRRITTENGDHSSGTPSAGTPLPQLNTNATTASYFTPEQTQYPGSKEYSTVDWYAEGPGRRVGYDELTAIDWIFEYAKERQRLRILKSTATGILGYLKQLVDASQIWWVLTLTGIATGVLAASIDVASDWLGDLKTGFCKRGDGGGRFHLNKAFCCWGLDTYSDCRDWVPWSKALHVHSNAGGWIIGYIFFAWLSVLFAASAAVLVKQFAVHAKQSGIPEMKTVLGGFVMRQFLSPWTLVVKSLGLCLAVASGLWLGKEGPLVHVACCCASLFLRLSRTLDDNEAIKREILSAAAAAGISVAFGAPVGGVLFSLEQLSYYFPDRTMWQSFVCAMIAAVSLQLFNPFRTGKLVLYQVTYTTSWHAFELVPFALLGIIGGLYGGAFIHLNMRINSFRRRINPLSKLHLLTTSPIFEVVVVAFLTAIINYPNKFMRAQSSELVATLFSECSEQADEQLGLCGGAPAPAVMFSLLSASFLGFLLSSITFGLRIPAGIILPSMAIGALYGRSLGLVMRTWQINHPSALIFATCEPDVPCITAGTYAIIGAASALAGATRMTVSTVVIMFELTGALTYVLPIMISVLISKWVGDAISPRGIYESWIHLMGYPFLDNRDDAAAAAVPDVGVSGLMTGFGDILTLSATGNTIDSLKTLLEDHHYRGFPVILSMNDPILLGYISRTELSFALSSHTSKGLSGDSEVVFVHVPTADASRTVDLRPWMDQTPLTLNVKSSLQVAVNYFLKLGLRYVLFVERGNLKGLLTRKDVWALLEGRDYGEGNYAVGGQNESDQWNDGPHSGVPGSRIGAGALREEGQGEGRGLLSDSRETDGAANDTISPR